MHTYRNMAKKKDKVKYVVSTVPMAKWRDKVEAAVDSVVLDVPSVQTAFISEVLFKLLVDVVFYWLPADANIQSL